MHRAMHAQERLPLVHLSIRADRDTSGLAVSCGSHLLLHKVLRNAEVDNHLPKYSDTLVLSLAELMILFVVVSLFAEGNCGLPVILQAHMLYFEPKPQLQIVLQPGDRLKALSRFMRFYYR